MPLFVSTKGEMVENMNDLTSDFPCLKVSALGKASRISGDVDQVTIGPDSIRLSGDAGNFENIENEQNSCNIKSPRKIMEGHSSKLPTRNGITFSVKKILLEEELQRKEKVWKEIDRHWQNMKENGRVIREQVACSRSYMARERERESAEKLAIILAEEEKVAEQEELRRKRILQLHAQRAQEQKERMEKEVEEYGKRMQERNELIQRTICDRDYIKTRFNDIMRLMQLPKHKAYAVLRIWAACSGKIGEFSRQMELIDHKIANGELAIDDQIVQETTVLYKLEIEKIARMCEEEINRMTDVTKELVQPEVLAKQQEIQVSPHSVNDSTKPAASIDADSTIQSEDKDRKGTVARSEEVSFGTLNSLDPAMLNSAVIATSEPSPQPDTSAQRTDDEPQKESGDQHTCRYVNEESLKQYVKAQEFLENYTKNYKDFLEAATAKKFRFECQKAINIPVNAISGISEQHLRDKYDRLYNLLAGKSSPNVGQHTHGAAFCKDTLAKKIVSQGETLVSSKPKMAFAIAAVTVALWNEHPDFGELLLAHFYKTCPFTVPVYMLQTTENQSQEEYYRSLGYKYSEDGSIEKQDKFLKRMSGLVRLYASITVTSQRKGVVKAHPHGLQNAWRWLAATLNCDPRRNISDLYATFILDMLEVTGNALWTAYPRQFKKLLLLLTNQYYPRMENSGGVSGGPLMRLEEFLKTSLSNGSIPPPDGYLSRNFW